VVDFIKDEGVFYHAALAPDVPFNDNTVKKIGEAVKKNLHRMTTPIGGEFDIKPADLF
jgi:hypothetical protein